MVQGNFIGTDVTGGLPLGNGLAGVDDQSGIGTRIGGTAAGAGNVISGNGGGGVRLSGTATAALVPGNFIGTNAAGTPGLGNVGFGVRIAADNNTIGGTAAGAGNVIAFTPDPSASPAWRSPTAGSATRSSPTAIFPNGGLGIDLGDDGLVAQRPGRRRRGGQQPPELPGPDRPAPPPAARDPGAAQQHAERHLHAPVLRQHRRATPAASARARRLGSTTVTTDAAGNATFRVTFPVDTLGQFITATATDAAGDTSEFSPVPGDDPGAGHRPDGREGRRAPAQGTVNQHLTYTVTVTNVSPRSTPPTWC